MEDRYILSINMDEAESKSCEVATSYRSDDFHLEYFMSHFPQREVGDVSYDQSAQQMNPKEVHSAHHPERRDLRAKVDDVSYDQSARSARTDALGDPPAPPLGGCSAERQGVCSSMPQDFQLSLGTLCRLIVGDVPSAEAGRYAGDKKVENSSFGAQGTTVPVSFCSEGSQNQKFEKGREEANHTWLFESDLDEPDDRLIRHPETISRPGHTMYPLHVPRTIFCTNCGKSGHVYKKCTYPITSIGVLCVSFAPLYFNDLLYYTKKIQAGELDMQADGDKLHFMYESIKNMDENNYDKVIKYLMVQRKHSLCYVDFLRGKYEMEHIEYLQNIFQYMTTEERSRILTQSFDHLWNELWSGNSQVASRDYSKDKDYLSSKERFEMLREGIVVMRNDIRIPYSLEKLVRMCNRTKYATPEWGFPKGRRNLRERNIECAKREFEEETNLAGTDYQITNISPIEEVFTGMNNVRYKHIYYVGQACRKIDLRMNASNEFMRLEIGNIQWFSYPMAMETIREYDVEKRNLLYSHHHFIKALFFFFQNHLRTLFGSRK